MTRPRLAMTLAVLCVVPTLASCGSGNDLTTSDEAVSAFEEAAGGYKFEKSPGLVEGAVAYGPVNSADPETVRPLNEGLGDGSIGWRVLVFSGDDPPLDQDAAKAAAFSSKTFKAADGGVYLGDYDTAYVANGNVVVTGPVVGGDLTDPTLMHWKEALDGL